MKTTIIPQIQTIEVGENPISLASYYLAETVLQEFPNAPAIFADNTPLTGDKPIFFIFADNISEEAYRIRAAANGIEIHASTSRGLMYALFTLSELDLINDGNLCEFTAFDAPALPLRGLSDDISRGQISTFENFCAIIRRLARYKYNTYMPYIEDVFRFDSVPAWGKYSDPLSKDEWRAIIAYAASWNLDVRPIVNLLGHFDKSRRIKEIQPLTLRLEDGTLTDCMDPTKPEVREMIVKMLAELVEVFGKGPIHCGGDEPLGLTQVFGEEKAGDLFIQHYTFIHNELEKLGCSLMMYADFFAPPWGDYSVPVDRAKEIPAGTDFVFWDYAYRPAYPFVDALHNQKIRMLMSPGTWTWKRFACDIRQCYDNTMGLLKADNGRSLGMVMSSWADGGDTLRELTAPGVLIGGNFSWNPQSDYDYDTTYALIHKTLYGFDEAQAKSIDALYHHDRLLWREHEHEFKLEMWFDPEKPVAYTERAKVSVIKEALIEAEKAYYALKPARNIDAFEALELTIARAKFTADKIAILPHTLPETIEDAAEYADGVLKLAGDLLPVKELHQKLWFKTNRTSEWPICEARYDDLYDQLRILARNLRLRRYFGK